MRRFLLAALLLSAPLHAADRLRWARRIAMAGACAATLVDYRTTVQAGRRGAIETNPLLAGANGQPAYGRILGVKLGFCGAALVVPELSRSRGMDRAMLGVGIGSAAAFTWAAQHNAGVR